MLRIIAGLEQPDEGARADRRRRCHRRCRPMRRHVGMVFQNFLLFPHKTVAENIVFPLRMQRVGQGRARRAPGLGAEAAAAGRARRPLSQRAVRRPAAARGAGARPDLAAGAAAARRAAGQSRPRAALGDGGRDPPLPEAAGDPLRLRHAQSGRSADDERPDRRHAQRRASSRSPPRPRSTPTRRRRSSPASSAMPTASTASLQAIAGGTAQFNWKGTALAVPAPRNGQPGAACAFLHQVRGSGDRARRWRNRHAAATQRDRRHAARHHLQGPDRRTTSSLLKDGSEIVVSDAPRDLHLQPGEAVTVHLARQPRRHASWSERRWPRTAGSD